jgi:hypothetical protein
LRDVVYSADDEEEGLPELVRDPNGEKELDD